MQDSVQDSVDLATAAVRLGLAAETVRKRLQRGKIKGFKTPGGTWRVVLDKVDSKQNKPGQAAGQEQDKPGQDDAPLVAALVAALRDEVHFLRGQLQARDEEIRRVHVLLQQEQQQVKALTDQRARRPWWRRLMGR
jgi:excisionase family DNA binding protein